MSMIRSIRRNIVKKELGTNDISDAWFKLQVAKMGPERYVQMRNQNRKVKKVDGRAHKVGLKFYFGDNGIQMGQENDKVRV